MKTRQLAVSALLLAADVVLTRLLAINTPLMKIGLGFAAVALCAMLYGPWWAALIAALGDFVGALLFPTGAYFPGFTLTAALTGLLYGLLLHKSQSLPRVALAVVLQQAVLSLGLNTYWLHILYGMPYVPTLVTRLVQAGIVTAVQLVVIPLIAKTIQQAEKRIST
jgi:ECF transporter S component (folate family)